MSVFLQPLLSLKEHLTPDHALALIHSPDDILGFTSATFDKPHDGFKHSSSSSFRKLRQLVEVASPSLPLRALQRLLPSSSYSQLHALADYLVSWRFARAVDPIKDSYTYTLDPTLPLAALLETQRKPGQARSLEKEEEKTEEHEKAESPGALSARSLDLSLHVEGAHEAARAHIRDKQAAGPRTTMMAEGGEREEGPAEEEEKEERENKMGEAYQRDTTTGIGENEKSRDSRTEERLSANSETAEQSHGKDADVFSRRFPDCPLSFPEMLELFCKVSSAIL